MPVIVNATEPHPFLPSLGDPAAIAAERALHQDIRPLEIAVINLMADKRTTERQLAHWLGRTPLQVHLTFAATDDYVQGVREGRETRNTPAEHVRKFYKSWSDIRNRKFDGLIVTGVNMLKDDVTQEDIWPAVRQICAWSETNVLSSLFLCWGALAALRHFHDIGCYLGKDKTWGVFEHRILSDKTDLLFGLPDRFPIPVSRWQRLHDQDLRKTAALEIVSDSDEGGAYLVAESATYDDTRLYPRRVYLLNHPEYDTDTLKQEYERDKVGIVSAPLPGNYFPQDNPAREPINTWRHTGFIYTNWVKAIYDATPYDIQEVPMPWSRAPRLAQTGT
ncbi:MAG: homoserine O-succinyltransferase [Bdellovibrionales bacterium]